MRSTDTHPTGPSRPRAQGSPTPPGDEAAAAQVVAALADLLPDEAATHATTIRTPPTTTHPSEHALVASATPARKREFLAGRDCAHTALSALGCDTAPIERGPAGEPRWPAGTVGSLTHTPTLAAAAAARSCDLSAVGIDLEPLDPPVDAATARLIHAYDDASASTAPPALQPYLSKLAFAVKESVYKALFPATRWRPGFADIRVGLDAHYGRWRAHFNPSFRLDGRLPVPLEGRMIVTAGCILAGVGVTMHRLPRAN